MTEGHMAEAIKAPDTTIIAMDPGIAVAKIQMAGLYGKIKGVFMTAIDDLTGPARRAKAPHQFRPDLRGNGTPRKRGKGKR